MAGDNCVEGLFGNARTGMQRQNMTGRRCASKAHVNFLASCWQLRKPGLYGVLEAMRIHRQYVQDVVPPVQAYKETGWLQVSGA